jgi:hypothetical protein
MEHVYGFSGRDLYLGAYSLKNHGVTFTTI